MRRKFSLPIILALLAGILCAAMPAQAADPVSTDRLLPSNVAAYLSISNVKDLKAKLKESHYGKLIEDDNLADFIGEVKDQIKVASGDIEKQLGLSLDDLLDLPSGEVAFAVVQQEGKPISMVTFLDFGENNKTLNTLLDKATAALKENGAKRTIEEFDDTEITVHSIPNEAVDEFGEPQKDSIVAYFVRDSMFVIGTSIGALETVLARWDGKHPRCLAENEVYQYIREQCRTSDSQALVSWYVDPIGLLKGAAAGAGANAIQLNLALGMLPALGIDKLKAIGGSIDIATSEFDSVNRMFSYVEQPTTGVLNVFKFPAIEQGPPKWVPENATAYFAANWDLATAYLAIEGLVDTFRGPGTFAALVDGLASNEDGPKIHLKKDIIDQLTGKIEMVSTSSDEAEQFLLGINLKGADKLQATLAEAAKHPGFPGKIREFRGSTIYEVPAGVTPDGGERMLAIAIAKNNLFVTSDVKLIESTILADANQNALVDSAQYKKIAEHFPAKTSLIGFQKQDTQIKQAYDLLRGGAAGAAGVPLQGIDFSKLPPFDAIQKYLKPTGTYVTPKKNGILFVSFGLK